MFPRPLLAAPLAVLLVACNSLTGVDGLTVGDGQPSGAGGGTGTGTGAGNGPGTGVTTGSGASTGTGGSTGNGASTGTGTGTTPTGPTLGPAEGVTITQIAIYQGPKRLLMGGTQTGTVAVPVVAGRDALVRVFTTTDGTYDQGPVTAQLFLGSSTQPIQVVGAVSSASTEADLSSTVNFTVPAAAMVAGVTYRVALVEPASKSTNAGASYPASGSTSLGAASDGAQLKVQIVPVKYGADGSNRLPDTDATQLQGYHDNFFAAYPAQAVDISVHAPFAWSEAISADGTGWSDLLDAVATLRQNDHAPADLYYFAAFQPAGTFDAFCGSGCVAGLGLIGTETDTYSRAAIGLGYVDSSPFTTAIHEIGHTQGRYHAPCGGAQNVDPAFPYSTGDIGDWGYNLVTKALIQPGKASDMMGYCDPVWISDYTFNAIFVRMKFVNGASIYYPPELRNRVWDRARVDMQGNLAWLPSVQLATPPAGQGTTVTVQTAGGSAAVGGQYFSYDHIPGGVLLWPAGTAPTTGISVSVGGKQLALAH